MNHPPYCKERSSDDSYLQLLRFARISGWSEDDYQQKDKNNLLQILKSLPESTENIDPILPLLYENTLKTGFYELLPSETQALLKDNTFSLLATDMAHKRWLVTTLEEFATKDIPIILIKGSAFANNLYTEAAPRLGVDIDFLVKEKDFEAVCSILARSMNPVVLSAERLVTHDTLFERMFDSDDKGKPIVEIHRGLTNPFIFNIEETGIWENSRTHPAYNSELVRILSPEDTLLHLAVHAFRDLDFCSHNLLDTHEIWCQWNPESEILLESAKYWGARKVLYYLLFNAKIIMGTPIPQSLLESLRPWSTTNSINEKVLRYHEVHPIPQKRFFDRLFQLISQITFPDKALNGIRFQLDYLNTRIKDRLTIHRK